MFCCSIIKINNTKEGANYGNSRIIPIFIQPSGEEVFDLTLNGDCEIELRLVNSQRFKIKVTDIVQTKYSMQEERAKECLGKFR